MKKKSMGKKISIVCTVILAITAIIGIVQGCSANETESGHNISGGIENNQGTIINGDNNDVSVLPEGTIKLNASKSEDFQKFAYSEYAEISASIYNAFDEINTNDSFNEGCLIYFNFTNTSDTDVFIEKFTFNGKQIKEIEYPDLYASFDVYNEEFCVSVRNDGWKDANNVKLKITSVNGILESYVDNSLLNVHIDKIPYGSDSASLRIFNISDLNPQIFVDNEQLKIETEWFSDEVPDGFKQIYPTKFILSDNGMYKEGIGGAGEFIPYGMNIPTDKSSCKISKDITNLSIPPKSVVRLPFFFFVRKTCSIVFNVEFHTSYTKTPLISEDFQLSIITNSFGYDSLVDGDDYDGDLVFPLRGELVGLFPYSIANEFLKDRD